MQIRLCKLTRPPVIREIFNKPIGEKKIFKSRVALCLDFIASSVLGDFCFTAAADAAWDASQSKALERIRWRRIVFGVFLE
jgi:hypothetical protein